MPRPPAVLLAALGSLACGAPTEIVLVIDAEAEVRASLRALRVESPGREPATLDDVAVAPPWTLGLRPAAGAGEADVTVVASLDGGRRITHRATLAFRDGERRLLYVFLARACIDRGCPDDRGRTCDWRTGACGPSPQGGCAFFRPLPRGPAVPCPLDGAADGGVAADAGGPRDAAPPADAAPRDGGGPGACAGAGCLLVAGRRHACATSSAGELRCWGANARGQATGARGPALGAPQRGDALGLGAVRSLAAGDEFTCALHGEDGLLCWGASDRAQLGFEGADLVQGVFDVRGLDAVEVVAGGEFACLRTAGGGLRCWGANEARQVLGAPGLAVLDPTPVDLGAGFVVAGVALGGRHGCAHDARGELRCWGDNGRAQLGPETFENPVSVPGLGPVRAVAAGREHTCAVVEGAGEEPGRVWCWGANGRGQAGEAADLRDVTSPRPVAGTDGAVDVVAGERHTCALLERGERVCWGANDGGALATTAVADEAAAPARAALEPLDAAPWAGLAAGQDYTCGRGADGAVYCWGWDLAGAVGQGAALHDPDPAVRPALAGAVRVAAGGDFTCAQATPQAALTCWGGGAAGQLGRGSRVPAGAPSALVLPSMVRRIAAGRRHACVALAAEGAVHCWGRNVDRQAGGTSEATLVVAPAEVLQASAFDPLTLGGDHGCVRLPSGGVGCWGRGLEGQLGDGAAASRSVPVETSQLAGAGSVAAGGRHSCARLSDGGMNRVFCWGDNGAFQLGDSTLERSADPVRVAGTEGAVLVAAGADFTCFARGSDDVSCFGANHFGQLGRGTRGAPSASTSVTVPGLPPDLLGLTAGRAHACAWSPLEVFCWGANESGQLGAGDSVDRASPVRALGLSTGSGRGVETVSAGAAHTCAILTESPGTAGHLLCWGSDEDGRLGRGRTLVYPSPRVVPGL